MKKIYLILAALGLFSAANAQQAFWDDVSYKGAFPITDGTAATDWTSGWANFNAENTAYPATTSTVSIDITTNTTWSGVILLQNKVYVKNNAVLTIQPGTIIRGDLATQATLIITRGARINAIGTVSQPIVFTSNFGPGLRQEGDWGGLVILGLAKNNQPGGVANIEGIVPTTDTQHGGNFDNDNSGTLNYVRVEFAGIALEPNKEINGITFGSVGSATTVNYVQVSHSGDDSFEWFGGTVNCKHLIAYRGLDDDFDTDFGYRGKVQFGLIIRDKDVSDAAGDSNSFESDNDAAGSIAQPKTAPVFSNITTVGPKGNGTVVLPVGEKFEKAFRLRRNTACSVLNSLVTGWEKGLSIEGASAEANVNGDTLRFVNNTLANMSLSAKCVTATPAFYATFFGADGNDTITTNAQINWVNIFSNLGTTPDARLAANSTVGASASFLNPIFYNLAAPATTATLSYCQGAVSSALTANAGVGNSLYWYTSAQGGIGSTTAPIPSTTTAGTFNYWVSQYNANGDESLRSAIVVTINATPVTPTISANGATSFCTGGSVDLTSSTANGNVWSTTATSQTITVTSTGTYTVTTTDGNGCSATSAVTSVNVSNAPIPTVNATALVGCSGDSITLTASNSDTYMWSTGESTQSIAVSTTDTYTVTTTNSNACNGVGTSTPTTITFTQSPTASGSMSTAGNVVTFTNTSVNATNYSWDFGDFTNSSAASPVHAFASNGTYTVILTATNGNCSDTIVFDIQISVGLNELENFMDVKLYPNPTNGNTTLVFENLTENEATIKIINQLGQLITLQNVQLTQGENAIKLNTLDLNNGLYIVVLETKNNSVNRRLIIQK